MAQKELINLLLDIQKKVRDSSEIYRHFESDKRAHFITLIEQQVMADVRKAVAQAMNRKFKEKDLVLATHNFVKIEEFKAFVVLTIYRLIKYTPETN